MILCFFVFDLFRIIVVLKKLLIFWGPLKVFLLYDCRRYSGLSIILNWGKQRE